jgi:hypothetical protein
MKRNILFILIICALPIFSIAQDRFGIGVGSGISKIDNYKIYFARDSDVIPYDIINYPYEYLFSWNGGFYYIKSFSSKPIEIGGEILVNCMGAFYNKEMTVYDDSTSWQTSPYSERLVYLSIPLFVSYKFNSCWYVQGGITNSVLISKQKKEFNQSNAKPYDLGANLTIGFCLFPKINFEIHAYHSLIRINPVTSWEGDYDNRLFNSSITFSLKYELWKRE